MGKTTLTATLRQSGVNLGIYINPTTSRRNYLEIIDLRVLAAQEMANNKRDKCLDERLSFTFETVMSHPSKIEILKQAKANGFIVMILRLHVRS